MEIEIKNEKEYKKALRIFSDYFHHLYGDMLGKLADAIEDYEEEHYKIELPENE